MNSEYEPRREYSSLETWCRSKDNIKVGIIVAESGDIFVKLVQP